LKNSFQIVRLPYFNNIVHYKETKDQRLDDEFFVVRRLEHYRSNRIQDKCNIKIFTENNILIPNSAKVEAVLNPTDRYTTPVACSLSMYFNKTEDNKDILNIFKNLDEPCIFKIITGVCLTGGPIVHRTDNFIISTYAIKSISQGQYGTQITLAIPRTGMKLLKNEK
jgi:hypothetical protein